MTKIKNTEAYPFNNPVSDNDYLMGTNGDTEKKETVNFSTIDIRNYLIAGLSPDQGGILKIKEIVYNGVLDTPAEVANQLYPNEIILRYEMLIFNVNGNKWLLKLQNIILGLGQTAVSNSDFIDIQGEQGIQGIQGEQGIQGIQGEQGIQGIQGPAGRGILSVSKTGTSGLVDTYTITYTDASTSTFIVTNGADAISNQQKTISYPADFTGVDYTLTNADNEYTIIVDNSSTAVTITIPTGLSSKIGTGFIQKGSADITFTASGTTINNPTGLKIKGQFYQVFIEQEVNTNVFYLLGNTKA